MAVLVASDIAVQWLVEESRHVVGCVDLLVAQH